MGSVIWMLTWARMQRVSVTNRMPIYINDRREKILMRPLVTEKDINGPDDLDPSPSPGSFSASPLEGLNISE